MKRYGTASWSGKLKDGKGTLSTGSGALRNQPYSFTTRFEETPGTNPEELIAAALTACFSMALSAELEKAGMSPERVETAASLDFEKAEGGWSTKGIHLQTRARVPGADFTRFKKAAEAAKAGCPVSRLLNTRITLSAELEGSTERLVA